MLLSAAGQAMNEAVLDFQQIHDEFRPKIKRYVARMVGEYDAEDLAQEVFTRVYRSLASFRGESQLSTWIYRIATNAALDRLRDPTFKQSEQNGLVDRDDEADFEVEDQDLWTGEGRPSPEQKLLHKQRYECYCDFIESLPPNYRTVVALSELGDLAAGEIADILGLSVDVVKVRLHRGRIKLLHALKSRCQAEDWL